MTADEIERALAAGETLDVEFKGEERRPLSDTDLVEAVVCLANRASEQTGLLLIGVEDDGRLTGARSRHGGMPADPLKVQALVSGRTMPSLPVVASLVDVRGASVLAIAVPPARQPVGTSDGRYLRRTIGADGRPACMPLHFHEMQSLQAARGAIDYSAAIVAGATWGDLDPLEFERYRRRIRESQGRGDAALQALHDDELARALGAVDDAGRVHVAGLLLFGRQEALSNRLPAHEVAFQVLRGTEVRANEFLRWPLVRIVDELEARFTARNQETELMVGMQRIGVPDYPERAFREAVANALIHRDYVRLGAVHVQWHGDRIDVSNPGGFPEGVRLDNLLVTAPHPRNPLLADAFKRAGVVERTARGVDTIFDELLRRGLPPPDYSQSGPTAVVVTMHGGHPNPAWARFVVEEGRAGRALALEDLLLLRAAAEGSIVDAEHAARAVQRSPDHALRLLTSLAERGLFRPGPQGGGYRLSASTLRRLGLRQPDRRVVRGDLHEVEQGVLRHVDTHGSVTRKEVSAAHGLSADQAKRLLAAMADRGLLERRGAGRGAGYVRAGRNRATAQSNGRPPDSDVSGRRRTPRGAGRHTKRPRQGRG